MSIVGLIGDTHFPAEHPGYFAFVSDTFEKKRVNRYVHMGDVTDMHNASFHDKHPGMPGPADEYQLAALTVDRWRKRFPRMDVCIGNHDERSVRLASKYGLAEEFLLPYERVWRTPKWKWAREHIIDGVLYTHGTGVSGAEHPAYNFLKKGLGMSVAIAHFHTRCGVKWLVGPNSRWFAMDVGCGVDRLHPAMQYDKYNPLKPILACAVVSDGKPEQFVMPCGPKEKYHRSRFTKKGRRR